MFCLVGFALILLPGGEDLLDFLRPFNLAAALVAELGLEKGLTFTVRAEESWLLDGFLSNGHVGNS
jgi:hypothetical protein